MKNFGNLGVLSHERLYLGILRSEEELLFLPRSFFLLIAIGILYPILFMIHKNLPVFWSECAQLWISYVLIGTPVIHRFTPSLPILAGQNLGNALVYVGNIVILGLLVLFCFKNQSDGMKVLLAPVVIMVLSCIMVFCSDV